MDTDASPSPSDLHTYNSESALMSSQLEIEMSEEKVEDGELTGVLEKTTSEDTKIKEKTDNAPKLPFIVLFAKFLWFGCRGKLNNFACILYIVYL